MDTASLLHPDVAAALIRVHRPRRRDNSSGSVAAALPPLDSMHGGGYVLGDRSMDGARFDRWSRCSAASGFQSSADLPQARPVPGPLEDC